MRKSKQRRRTIVGVGLQTRMVARAAIIVVAIGLVLSLGFFVYFWVTYSSGSNSLREFLIVYRQVPVIEEVQLEDRQVDRREYRVEAQPETTRWRIVLPVLIFNNLLFAGLVTALSVWYSHRFAGPVYRISSDISRALRGEESARVNLRQGDELRDLAQQVNRLLDALDNAEGETE